MRALWLSSAALAMGPFKRFSWVSLALVVAVILWGAYVRASGSGAGCGSHWPTCNGEVVPHAPGSKTIIELTHRITSGLSAIMVLVQAAWATRLFPRGHRARASAAWGAVFMVVEVLIGAGIVLLRYVADDASVGRALWMALHLVNTFLLVGAMTLTAHFASGGAALALERKGTSTMLGLASLAGTVLVGMSGAVAALGDTLFPADSLGTALADDLSPTAHVLVRLRIIHPFAAIGVAMLLLLTRFVLASRRPNRAVRRWGLSLRLTLALQLVAGFVNLMTLAPTALQIVHLLLAQVLWIVLVLFLASALAEGHEPSMSVGDVVQSTAG